MKPISKAEALEMFTQEKQRWIDDTVRAINKEINVGYKGDELSVVIDVPARFSISWIMEAFTAAGWRTSCVNPDTPNVTFRLH